MHFHDDQASAVRPAVLRSRVVGALCTLAPLARAWEACGVRCEALAAALGGGHGVALKELESLEKMAKQWSYVDTRLQKLLLANTDQEFVRVFLWHLVIAEDALPSLHTIGQVSRLWEEHFGYPPPITLFALL